MRGPQDPLASLLVRTGALTEDSLADVLDQQQRTLPLGSLCYILGHLDEDTLARALSRQYGFPGVVLDRSVIHLGVLDGVPREAVLHHRVLPVFEDQRRLFVAAEDPRQVPRFIHEIAFKRGRIPVVHVALPVTLARTSRACFWARERGEPYWFGPAARYTSAGERGSMAVVSDVEPDSGQSVGVAPVHPELLADATRELERFDLLMDDETTGVDTAFVPGRLPTTTGLTDLSITTPHPRLSTEVTDSRSVTQPDSQVLAQAIGLDSDDIYTVESERPKHVLVVDRDTATQNQLIRVLSSLGLLTTAVADSAAAIRHLEQGPPDVVILDVVEAQSHGLRLCQTIKHSLEYKHIAVILISAVIDSGQVTDEVLHRYEAEAYYEKPIDTESLKQRIQDLLEVPSPAIPTAHDNSFENAMELYRAGDTDRAIEVLRAGLEVDPLSARHHFVLANLLQKKSLLYEAIDEYEATIDLKPDYFPALTRLAYLYYKKGFAAKAIEMWRRSLPHCTDASLRHNIEMFMRKLIAEMHSQP